MSPSHSTRPLPPRMPSPQLVPAPLPSPPLLPRRSSRNRLHLPAHPDEPPIPPRLIGSPLLKKLTSTSHSEPHLLSQKVQSELWIDGDEFGIRRTADSHPDLPSPASSTSSSSKRGHRRTSSVVGSPSSRSRSPPPAPLLFSPPPPVPPIPSFALAVPGARRARLRSQPTHHKQIIIPNLDFSSPLDLAPPHKRNSGPRQLVM
ncbi:hypothetical protein B0H21DRAFT_185822 [Amylocystis lapponica]|nr:hypothetical protein B0H21DRAFT_185822 [Amylocystis lapponica]